MSLLGTTDRAAFHALGGLDNVAPRFFNPSKPKCQPEKPPCLARYRRIFPATGAGRLGCNASSTGTSTLGRELASRAGGAGGAGHGPNGIEGMEGGSLDDSSKKRRM